MRSWRGPRHAQAQGTAPAIRQDMDRGAEAAPAAAPRRIRLFLLGRARRAADRSGLACRWARRRGQTPWLHPAATRAQVRPSVPSSTMLPRKDGNPRPCLRVCRSRCPEKNGYGATGYRSSGPSSGQQAKDKAGREDNRGRAGGPGNRALMGSRPPVTTHTRRGAWVFCTWRWLGSG